MSDQKKEISLAVVLALVLVVILVGASNLFPGEVMPSPTPTATPTPMPTGTPTYTSTPAPTGTGLPTPKPSVSPSPTITPTPTPSSTPTPTPSINILSINNVTDEGGYLHVFGEIENNGTDFLKSVQISVNLYDASNMPIPFPSSAYIFLDVIRPGEKSPFEFSVHDPGNVARYEVHVLGAQVTTEQSYRDFEILSNSTSVDAGKFIVVGEVRNIGSETAEIVHVIGTFYNSEGKIVALGFSYTAEAEIQPNQTGTFEMGLIFEEIIQEIDHYTLLVEGTPKA